MNERSILHSDMNCFYASVEMMLDPKLRNRAVAVCGSTEDRHGIVLAKSEMAKKAGVKTGMVNWEAKQKCPELILVPPHYEQYLKYSALARNIYGRFTDLTLLNVQNKLVRRSRSIVQPNVRLELYFSMSSSSEISLGSFYIDRTSVTYPEGKVSVSARNTIGKLLKEQTFDENGAFTAGDLMQNLTAVMEQSQVEQYFIADPQKTWNLTFAPTTTILDGLTQVVALLPGWELKETTAGVIGIWACFNG